MPNSKHDCTKCYAPILTGQEKEVRELLYHEKCAPKSKQVIAYVVVDKSQGGTHVDEEPHGTKSKALDRAHELNAKRDTTRYIVKPLYA
jgi:hypothetical protein